MTDTETREGSQQIVAALALDAEEFIAVVAQLDCFESMTRALLGDVERAERLRRLVRLGLMSPPTPEAGRDLHALMVQTLAKLGLEPVDDATVMAEMRESATRLRAEARAKATKPLD